MNKLLSIFLLLVFYNNTNAQLVESSNIGIIRNFHLRDEAFVIPKPTKSFDNSNYEFIISFVKRYGELISDIDEVKTYIFTDSIAEKYFQLIPEITIYSKSGLLKTKGSFKRLEFINDTGFEDFYAVYEIDSSLDNHYYYFVSSNLEDYKKSMNINSLDPDIYESVFKSYVDNNNISLLDNYYSIDAFSVDNKVYLIGNTANKYYFFEYNEEQNNLDFLYKSDDEICSLRYYPISIEGRFFFLMEECQCDTDFLWTELLELENNKLKQIN
ncbi:hypothetical protein [Flammeovirga sp. EKP202]|uniref:hypothetical protein n=1 Tax=Flammeovirga sp. EKP202 TaxID=2770592 RepID=UPI00165ED22B|nr:hypothetical protein [Flammeovirga sp. EKP202]MBD0405181.1 hypothetical protein [Flammeovirga sp. EKP202]